MQKEIQNSAEIRELNRRKILSYLRKNQPITKRDLSLKLDLSFASVSNMCNMLLEEGLLKKRLSAKTKGGRVPQLISIDEKSKYSLSLNLSRRTYYEIFAVNLCNEIILEKRRIIGAEYTYNQLIEDIRFAFDEIVNDLGVATDSFIGLGVAVSGVETQDSHSIINSNLPLLENKKLKEDLSNELRLNVFVENDANLMVMAKRFSSDQNCLSDNIIYVYISEAMGVGIVSGGVLVKGHIGIGGEISHIPAGKNDYTCYCGNTNCIESELCISGIIRQYNEFHENSIEERRDGLQELELRINGEDKNILEILQMCGRRLGVFISIMVNLFDPEVVYIGGIFGQFFDVTKESIYDELRKRVLPYKLPTLKIVGSNDSETLVVKGCAELVFDYWTL